MALLFLAVWHGFHPGYYLTFASEFLVVLFEKDLYATLAQSTAYTRFRETPCSDQVQNKNLKSKLWTKI